MITSATSVASVAATNECVIARTLVRRPGDQLSAAVDMPNFETDLFRPPISAATRAAANPYAQIEQMLVRNMIEAILPEDGLVGNGGGLAGEYWSSMMADEMAKVIAQTGTLGIAENIKLHLSK